MSKKCEGPSAARTGKMRASNGKGQGVMKAGPRHADFEDLYERHSREVWALAYARWMNADVALDIMQEAFTRLWKQWQAGENIIVNPRAWLLRVARNLAEDFAKSSFHRNGTQPPQTMNGVKGREDLPLEKLERDETCRQLRVELDQMAAADREILTLRYALDYNADEIADLLEINTTAVHMRLSRARQRLAERLTARGIVNAL
jgi:RNA polymerase sigma-70 factor (ECF subfamily)